ncbi:hypothetical protein MYX65_00235 [Acidobacteria bacterium AH-259-L09]|nr:hypothetical protein [Acidobacteria bacterium AH-259-L09]
MWKKVFTGCFVVFFGVSYGLAASPVPVLGQVIANSVQMDGMSVPSGTTVLNNTVVKTSKDPAFIHLNNSQVVQLHRNSSAYLERTSSGEVQVTVRSGTMSFRTVGGKVMTAPPESVIVFPYGSLPVANPQQASVLRVILTERAEAGQDTIVVNDSTRIEPKQAILIRSPDGETQEIHYVEAFDGNNVKLTARLENTFEANSVIIQDPSVLEQAVAVGAVVVGVAAGVSIGAAAVAGVAVAVGAAALSTAAIVGIVAGVTAATVGTLVATDVIGGDEEPPPASP